ncbi:cupin domain-containing protein [Myxococcaceae bacterium JPH2]|nr:cupin domain-containing protein [Myxococcaceae bacterium JPH2]
MATVVRGERRPFGPIRNDISGLAVTRRQIGGEGACRWKMLMNGMHLEGQWNCVEYGVIEPGGSVGEHVHLRTEEIYYIVSGHPVMTINGVEQPCAPGDLITTPIGCAHAIANPTTEDMHFFVVEVFPGKGPSAPSARFHLPDLRPVAGGAAVDVDLRPHFTGDWKRFRLMELAPGVSDTVLSASTTEVVHVLSGSAAITVESERYTGAKGLSVAIPPGLSRTLKNVDSTQPLRMIITEVTVA